MMMMITASKNEDLVEEIYILNEHGLNGAYARPLLTMLMRGLQEATRKTDERLRLQKSANKHFAARWQHKSRSILRVLKSKSYTI